MDQCPIGKRKGSWLHLFTWHAALHICRSSGVLPWLEAIPGLLVLTGLRTRIALIAGSILLIVLTFRSTLHQDWESAGLQLIYASVYAALLAFLNKNTYSLDALFPSRQRVRE